MLRRLTSVAALVLVATSARAQFPDSLDPFGKGAVCAGGAVCTIKSGLVAYWKLDEASGTRVDSVAGAYSLTATNTPGSTAGKVGDAVDLVVGSSQYLSTSSTLTWSGDWTVAGWFRLRTTGANRAAWSSLGSQNARVQFQNAVTRYRFFVSGASVDANTFGAVSTGVWNFVVCDYTNATTTGRISVNDGAFDSSSSMSPPTTNGGINVGANQVSAAFWDGAEDEIGVWTRKLTATEITYLYNTGSGRSLYAWLEFWWPGLRRYAELDWRLWLSADDLRLAA